MEPKEYLEEMGRYIAGNFKQEGNKILVERAYFLLLENMNTIVDYYERNISPDMAGEFIANKLNLTRDLKGRN